MKRFAIRALFVAAAAIGLAAQAARAQVDVSVTIGGFHDELAPYGRWVDCSYGQCWVPERVAADWQPYSNGQWIYTEYGWTWVSSDPWGGNPYHYGTWASIPGYGWSWVPGTVWAPAWVTWSYSNSYVGWAPLPPTVVFGASGYSGRPVVVRETQYVFVPTNRFVGRDVAGVRVPAGQSAVIFKQTKPVTGFAVSGGIVHNVALPMQTVEHASGVKIQTRNIETARTAPRAVPAGNTKWAVVAPASELKASAASRPAEPARAAKSAPVDNRNAAAPKAHGAPPPEPDHHAAAPPAREAKAAPASRPQAAPQAAEPARADKQAKAPVDHEAGAAKAPKSHPAPPPEPREANAPKPHDAQPPEPREANAPKAHAAPPPEPQRQAAEPPAAHRPPPRPAQPAAKPKPQPEQEKPGEKDKKPDGDKP